MFFNKLFLAADGAGGGLGAEGADPNAGSGENPTPQIDYGRIQQMLDGTLKAKEDTALKAYFKQQGLTPEQAQQAINDFKTQQQANQPDMGALQTQLAQAQAEVQRARIEAAATTEAVAIGIDAKTIPYVLKMADLSQVMGTDGKLNDEALKNALNKVLEDVPALKPQPAEQAGFVQVGTTGQNNQKQNDQLASIFGNKR